MLNAAQLVALYPEDIVLTEANRQGNFKHYPPDQLIAYTIQLMMTSRREMEFLFNTKEERNSSFEAVQKALNPTLVPLVGSSPNYLAPVPDAPPAA